MKMRRRAVLVVITITLAATKNWKFKPATVDGLAVKFRKVISIAAKPAN